MRYIQGQIEILDVGRPELREHLRMMHAAPWACQPDNLLRMKIFWWCYRHNGPTTTAIGAANATVTDAIDDDVSDDEDDDDDVNDDDGRIAVSDAPQHAMSEER